MELTLTPELERLIARKLESGRYESAEQIVVEALKNAMVLDDQRQATLDALKHMISDGGDESAKARETLRQRRDDWSKMQS